MAKCRPVLNRMPSSSTFLALATSVVFPISSVSLQLLYVSSNPSAIEHTIASLHVMTSMLSNAQHPWSLFKAGTAIQRQGTEKHAIQQHRHITMLCIPKLSLKMNHIYDKPPVQLDTLGFLGYPSRTYFPLYHS
eukprot:1813343-Amphidinium_carterae.1